MCDDRKINEIGEFPSFMLFFSFSFLLYFFSIMEKVAPLPSLSEALKDDKKINLFECCQFYSY